MTEPILGNHRFVSDPQPLLVFAVDWHLGERDRVEERHAGGLKIGVGSTKESFENEARVDLSSERSSRTAPGDMGTVDAGVADVGIDAYTHRVNG